VAGIPNRSQYTPRAVVSASPAASLPPTEDLISLLRGPTLAVLVYGSVARGDATEASDLDLLQLVPRPMQPYTVGKAAVSPYSGPQLERMCHGGSLFALHLVTEGRVLFDPDETLAQILGSYRPPESYDKLWTDIGRVGAILDTDPTVIDRNIRGFVRLALYLVRTAATLRQLQQTGVPLFAMGDLAVALGAPQLPQLFEGREDPSRASRSRFTAARRELEHLLGAPVRNTHGSLEALIVNEETRTPVAAVLALRLLSRDATLGYGDLLLDPVLPGV
jgi:hypothetical protein